MFKCYLETEEKKTLDLKVPPTHDVPDRLFLLRRALFRLNDNLPGNLALAGAGKLAAGS